MSEVDLQLHTTYSDGAETPREVISGAAKNGVHIVAVTDHDTVAGVSEAISAGKELGVTVIPGVEITTARAGKNLHILGYGIDTKSEDLHLFLEPIYAFRRENLLRKVELVNTDLLSDGKKAIDLKGLKKEMGDFWNTPRVANFMVSSGVTAEREEAFALLRGAVALPLEVKPEDAIGAIHAAGGIAVLSHPFAPKLSLLRITDSTVEQEKVLEALCAAGLDGIECFQSGHGPAETARALELAKKHQLLVTGGSDWHGSDSELGEGVHDYIPHYPEHIGGLDVPTEAVRPILEKLGINVDKT